MGRDKQESETDQYIVNCYSAGIVGLGRMGQGYDYAILDDAVIATHASAYYYHSGYELVGAVDPDVVQRERFTKKFNRPAYHDVGELMQNHRPQVVSLSVPTNRRLRVFEDIIQYHPLAVLCEKPIAPSMPEAKTMLELAEQNGCSIIVNYVRRFEPGVLQVKMKIEENYLGDIYKGVVWYSKGLLNNGSHFVDLLRFLLGEVCDVELIAAGRRWDGEDPEPDFCLYFKDCRIYFMAAREECFSLGEMNLIGTRGIIHYGSGGGAIEIQHVMSDPIFNGYLIPAEKENIINDMNHYQWHVMDKLYDHLSDSIALSSDGRSAMETLSVVDRVIKLIWQFA